MDNWRGGGSRAPPHAQGGHHARREGAHGPNIKPKAHWPLGPSLTKKQKEFRRLFEFPEDEEIVASFNCSMRAGGMLENMVQGTMFITPKHVCFHSTFWGTERKEVISFDEVRAIEKKNTARIIPNALEISVERDEKEVKSLEVSEMTNTYTQQELLGQARLAMSKVAERYEVTRPLGEGGFGKAFVVLDKQDFRQYVLKRMDCSSEEEAANAVKEMVLLRLMKHPYIVGYRDFWRDNLTVYIVMEYCEGGDMALLIEQQQSHFSEQAVLAIEHMHAHNVLHRDIKPNNLFLNRWQDLKLGDFGLSAVAASGSKLLHAVGTLGYAAPEILRHKPYDSKSDIYALGCTLYEIVTLRSVYDDQNLDIFPVSIPSEYSRDLERLVLAMIAKDPEKRPSASEILGQPLLAPYLGKISTESEIYGELQQREDENQQLLLKLRLLEAKLQGKSPDSRDTQGMLSNDGLMYQYEDVDVYDPILSLASPSEAPSELSDDSEQEKVEDKTHQVLNSAITDELATDKASIFSQVTNPFIMALKKSGISFLAQLPLALTVAGLGLGVLFRFLYCWTPLWMALAFIIFPIQMDDLGSPRWAIFPTWLRLRKGGRFLSVIVAPMGALLLLYALGNDPLFAVALLVLYAACPGLSALAHHDDEISSDVLSTSVGAALALAAGVRASPIGSIVVELAYGITHLAARRWLFRIPLMQRTGMVGYVATELLVGLAIIHGVASYCLPAAAVRTDHGFVAGVAICVAASLICAVGCRMPQRRRNGRGVAAFCALATLVSLLVAAKALAAGLLACDG